MKIECRLKRRGPNRANPAYQTTYVRSSQPKKKDQTTTSTSTSRPKANQARGEEKARGKVLNDPAKMRSRDVKCFKCLGVGHITFQCPNKRTMIMLTNGEVITHDEKEYERMLLSMEDEDESEEELPTNDHVGLVARNALTAQIKEEEF